MNPTNTCCWDCLFFNDVDCPEEGNCNFDNPLEGKDCEYANECSICESFESKEVDEGTKIKIKSYRKLVEKAKRA